MVKLTRQEISTFRFQFSSARPFQLLQISPPTTTTAEEQTLAHPPMASESATSFSDFPEDVQLNILSFLSPADLSSMACTSRRFAALCAADSAPLWVAVCHRRWGSKTLVRSWIPSPSPVTPGTSASFSFARLYKALERWEDLIGFWRRIGRGNPGTPALVLFEWGPTCITGYRVSPSRAADPAAVDPAFATYGVLKIPFIWLGISSEGQPVSFLYPGGAASCAQDPPSSPPSSCGLSDPDLVPVTISFMGNNHFVVEENRSFYPNSRVTDSVLEEVVGIEGTSPPDQLMSEIYQYFANRKSPGGEKPSRRQRRKERERSAKQQLWQAEHYVKVTNHHPTPDHPLQGLWKGISEDMILEFYLVAYDDVGGITCRRVSEIGERFSGYSPVFWTSNTTFIEPPFLEEEQDLYAEREHIFPVSLYWRSLYSQAVTRILCINSSYELVIPGSSGDPRNVEGRIWEYEDGTFGFGFLRNNCIVDLKPIYVDGTLLDTVEYLSNGSSS